MELDVNPDRVQAELAAAPSAAPTIAAPTSRHLYWWTRSITVRATS